MIKEIALAVGILATTIGGTYGLYTTVAFKSEVAAVQNYVFRQELDQVERRIFELKQKTYGREMTEVERREMFRLIQRRNELLRMMGS